MSRNGVRVIATVGKTSGEEIVGAAASRGASRARRGARNRCGLVMRGQHAIGDVETYWE